MECDVSITVDQDLPKYEETTFNPWSEDESELEISVDSDSSDGLCEHNAAMLQAEIGIDEQENIDDPPTNVDASGSEASKADSRSGSDFSLSDCKTVKTCWKSCPYLC